MKLLIYLSALSLIFLSACRKGEIPVGKADRGSIISQQFGDIYGDQIWFKLNGNHIVNKNSKYEWDLAFEAGDKGNHVLLNSAKQMFGLNTHKQNFDDVKDTFGFGINKQCDRVASLDSSVLGIFEAGNSFVYIIDLGLNMSSPPQTLGIKKLQFISNTPSSFTFKCANIDGSNLDTFYFIKSDNYNFLYFSIRDKILKTNIEPTKKEFDLEFTQYTDMIFDDATGNIVPYLVGGVLLNRCKVEACKIEGKPYELVSLKDTLNHPLSKRINTIGYDWKTPDKSTGLYTIEQKKTYIIKDMEGYFYKLRFIGFYLNPGAVKGYPQFEYQKL